MTPWTNWPWKWGHHNPLKYWQVFTKQHGIRRLQSLVAPIRTSNCIVTTLFENGMYCRYSCATDVFALFCWNQTFSTTQLDFRNSQSFLSTLLHLQLLQFYCFLEKIKPIYSTIWKHTPHNNAVWINKSFAGLSGMFYSTHSTIFWYNHNTESVSSLIIR